MSITLSKQRCTELLTLVLDFVGLVLVKVPVSEKGAVVVESLEMPEKRNKKVFNRKVKA